MSVLQNLIFHLLFFTELFSESVLVAKQKWSAWLSRKIMEVDVLRVKVSVLESEPKFY